MAKELTITWSWEDIKGMREAWSQEECEQFLSDYEHTIQERSIEAGAEAIEYLIKYKEQEKF